MHYKEIWKPIKGFENRFIVSNTGRIKSLDMIVSKGFCGDVFVKGKELTQIKNCKNGYMYVGLTYGKIRKNCSVHRIVANAFPEICGEWFDGCCVDHLDTNKENNNAYNLRVCTYSENNNNYITRKKHSLSTKGKPNGRKGIPFLNNRGKNHHNSKLVIQLTLNGNEINKFFGTGEASRVTGICKSSIRACCSGKYKRAGNFIFKWGLK